MIRIAINGYGRIGRVAHRVILEKHNQEVEVVAINTGSSTDLKGWMYLLQYDTNYGTLGKSLKITPNSDEAKKDFLGILTVDGTGHVTTEEKLEAHIQAGAKAVVLSAPAKGDGVPTYVESVNAQEYKKEKIINNASCTTNCIAPVAKIMVDHFGVEKAMMTTIHGYTSDQSLQDGGHKDYRRARAAAENIIPTTTGAAIAATQAVPALKGLFDGLAIRVPVPVGSLSDFTFLLKKETTRDEVNRILKEESV